MDTSGSEVGDGSSRLSLSLISYSSDVEEADSSINSSSYTLTSEPAVNVTQKSRCLSSSSNEDELIRAVANQLGLSGISNSELEKIGSAYEKMKASQLKYQQSKMIFDTIEDIARTPSDLPPQTAERVQHVLDHLSLLDFVAPTETDGADGVFGISQKHLEEWLPIDLSCVDIKHLQEATEKKIVLKHQKLVELKKRHNDILSSVNEAFKSDDAACRVEQKSINELLSLRKELDHEISINQSLMRELDNVLSTLTKLKLEDFDTANNKQIESFQSRCALIKSQIQSLNDQIQSEILFEDSHVIEAYAALQKNLDVAIMEAKTRLAQLQKKETDYKKLQGTQYDHLLKEYLDLKAQIAQKEYALNNMFK